MFSISNIWSDLLHLMTESWWRIPLIFDVPNALNKEVRKGYVVLNFCHDEYYNDFSPISSTSLVGTELHMKYWTINYVISFFAFCRMLVHLGTFCLLRIWCFFFLEQLSLPICIIIMNMLKKPQFSLRVVLTHLNVYVWVDGAQWVRCSKLISFVKLFLSVVLLVIWCLFPCMLRLWEMVKDYLFIQF